MQGKKGRKMTQVVNIEKRSFSSSDPVELNRKLADSMRASAKKVEKAEAKRFLSNLSMYDKRGKLKKEY